MSIYYDHRMDGVGSKRFWQWFDRMPKEVRDAINNGIDTDESILAIWADAVFKYGPKIKMEIKNEVEMYRW